MKLKNIGSVTRAVLAILCAVAMFCGVLDHMIPDRLAVRPDALNDTAATLGLDIDHQAIEVGLSSPDRHYVTIGCDAKLFGAIPLKRVDVSVYRDVNLIAGGVPFGVKLYTEGVVVLGVGEVQCDSGAVSPARDAGIMEKDVICAIDGSRVSTVEEIIAMMNAGDGRSVSVTVNREGSEMTFDITPVRSTEDGKYRAGLWIKDSTAGIGTVTYIDPDQARFAGLGHGICDGDTGELIPLTRGTIVNVAISGVVKGQPGLPGELKGYFSSGKIGTLLGNKECGVYGIFAELPAGVGTEAIPIALSSEIREGTAQLLCTIDGSGVCAYTVNISNIDHTGRNVKNFIVTVTDPALLERTGGIVQGMSGSPIIQDGKIVGAVTHVLINDPTKGYGIFIENMLDAAG